MFDISSKAQNQADQYLDKCKMEIIHRIVIPTAKQPNSQTAKPSKPLKIIRCFSCNSETTGDYEEGETGFCNNICANAYLTQYTK